jgi:RNA polymerase sigma factor (sigma-70 family)
VARVVGDDGAAIAASRTDSDRFAEVFRRHGSSVYRYLARRLGPEHAEDLTAEVFLAAFKSRARYDHRLSSALPWLYGIAANVAAQHRREEARRWRLLAALPTDDVTPDNTWATDSRVNAASVRGTLVELLHELPQLERDVLLLIAWEQLTQSEVAETLAIPVGTVRSRLHRARTQIRAQLAATALQGAERTSVEEMLGYE